MTAVDVANITRQLLDLLRARHDQPTNGTTRAWVYAEEVRVATGYDQQAIDAFALHTWPTKEHLRVAYEVKTSTHDLQRELAQPRKCEAAVGLSNQFYLVAGPDVKLPAVLPSEWGVMVVVGGRLVITRQAVYRHTTLPPYSFMLSLARNLQAVADRGQDAKVDA